MHQISLSDAAYKAFSRRAKDVGLTVEEYLNECAPQRDFALTPEMRAGIERGLAQADAGKTIGIAQVRESLKQYRSQWRERKR